MTNEQRFLTVADDHEFLLSERPRWARLSELLDAPQAREVLGLIDAKLASLKAEAAELKAERTGGVGSPDIEEALRYRRAFDHTREIDGAFRADLARLGHGDDHTPEVRRQIEEQALGLVEETHGTAAADRCRRLLAPLPRVSPDLVGEPLDGGPLSGPPMLP